eukprot:gene49889-67753_t
MESHSTPGRGRPRVSFLQRRDSGYIVSVRISSDQVQYSLVDYSGTLMDRFEEARKVADEKIVSFVAGIRSAVGRLADRSKLPASKILVVSISSKGLVDQFGPKLLWSPVFGSEAIDFADVFSDLPHAKIILSNETLLVAAALGR